PAACAGDSVGWLTGDQPPPPQHPPPLSIGHPPAPPPVHRPPPIHQTHHRFPPPPDPPPVSTARSFPGREVRHPLPPHHGNKRPPIVPVGGLLLFLQDGDCPANLRRRRRTLGRQPSRHLGDQALPCSRSTRDRQMA